MAHRKVSKEESLLLERIFMLQISIDLLKQGRRPFHDEAISILKKKIKNLKHDHS